MSRYRWALAGLASVVVVALAVTLVVSRQPAGTSTVASAGADALVPAEQRTSAPNFTGIDGWLNSGPLGLDELHGKVVLVDFWTFSCVNCVRTIPHLQRLQQTYGGRGLVIVGVHSPEFDFEKDIGNVSAAVRRLGVTWPVAVDSQMSTWNAYGNQYWPAEYLLDQMGRVAYIHVGEGQDAVTDGAVASLLGVRFGSPPPAAATPDPSQQTPELYAGSDRGQLADGEAYGAMGNAVSYADHGPPQQNDQVQLTGSWADHGQYVVTTAAGHVRLRFRAGELFVVAGPQSGRVQAQVSLDGLPVAPSQRGPDLSATGLDVGAQTLYHVLTAQSQGRHLIDVAVPAGFRLYTFTFG